MLLGEHRSHEPDAGRLVRKIPTTFVLLFTSLLSRSSGLLDQIFCQCSDGKAA